MEYGISRGPGTLPTSWTQANWRNVTAVAPADGRLGIGFDVPGHPTVRMAVSVEDALTIAYLINKFCQVHISECAGTQLPISGLMSSDLNETVAGVA